MRMVLRFKEESDAEAAAKKPGVRRIGAHTVACEVPRQCDVVKWLSGTEVESAATTGSPPGTAWF